MVMLAASMRYLSTLIWISRSGAPPISTREISGSASIRSCRSSANSLSCARSISPEILTFMIGSWETSISMTSGSSVRSFGSSGLARSIASLTSILAASTSISVSNSTITLEKSCTDVLEISLTPSSDLSSFSMCFVTRFSMSLGEVPSLTVMMKNCGNTTSGNCSLGMLLKAIRPAMEMITVMT